LIRYIHRNPLEVGLASRPQEYVWSSDRYYRRGKAPEWLSIDRALPLLGPTRRIAIARYRKLMGDAVEESYENIESYAQAIKSRIAGGIPGARMASYLGREESTLTRGVLSLEMKMNQDSRLRRAIARLDASLQA
jgi:hypothetical protein